MGNNSSDRSTRSYNLGRIEKDDLFEKSFREII